MGTTGGDLFSLELVSHCWGYDRALCFQLSSLVLHPPQSVRVTATVFFCPQDERTTETLAWFAGQRLPPRVAIRPWPLERTRLLRRAIGRNLAAKETRADAVWFADVDYIFGRDCIDAIPAAIESHPDSPLFYPRQSHRNQSDGHGDALIERITQPTVYPISDFEFPVVERNSRAIGGIQICRGDVARERGYLPDSEKWQRPAERWRRTFEDRAYRGALGTNGTPIDLPNLFRLRHSKRGRFDVGCRN